MCDEEKIAAYPEDKIIKLPDGVAHGVASPHVIGRAQGAKAGAPAFLHSDPIGEQFGTKDDKPRSKWGNDGKTANINKYMRYYMKKWRKRRAKKRT